MPTECSAELFEFAPVEGRKVVGSFDGGTITSNAGALLLGQLDRGLGLIRRFAACFTDRRDPRFVEHQVETLVGQRVFGLALARLCTAPWCANAFARLDHQPTDRSFFCHRRGQLRRSTHLLHEIFFLHT